MQEESIKINVPLLNISRLNESAQFDFAWRGFLLWIMETL